MPDHYNLYYLLLEDQQNNLMSETRSQQIRQAVELLRKMDIPMRKVYVRQEDGIMKEMPV